MDKSFESINKQGFVTADAIEYDFQKKSISIASCPILHCICFAVRTLLRSALLGLSVNCIAYERAISPHVSAGHSLKASPFTGASS